MTVSGARALHFGACDFRLNFPGALSLSASSWLLQEEGKLVNGHVFEDPEAGEKEFSKF